MTRQRMHGLWRFHEAAKGITQLGARWWIDEELEMARRLMQAVRLGYGRALKYSNADAIARCVFRYVRRFNLPCNTVKQWNALVLMVAKRAGFTHHATLESVCIQHSRNARLDWRWSACSDVKCPRPFAKWSRYDVASRLERIKLVAAKRKPCRWCGVRVHFKPSWLTKYDDSVRCNAPDCRRMDYLRRIPQSRGGIQLTFRQRELLPQHTNNSEFATAQMSINYLILRAKEVKHGRKSAHDVR